MRHFCLTLFLLLSCIFLGYASTTGDATPSLSAEESGDVAPPNQAKAPSAGPDTAAPAPSSANAGAAAQGVENLQADLSADKQAQTQGQAEGGAAPPANAAPAEGTTPPVTTASGAPSLVAAEKADVQTPAEEQAQQQKKAAIDKENAAQAQKTQADKDKAAAKAKLSVATTPEEKEEAEAQIKRAKQEENDAKKAQEDAERSKKDADKAFATANKNGKKLRAAKLEAVKAREAEAGAQSKADEADAELEKAEQNRDQQAIENAKKKSKQAHKDLLKAKSARAKIDKNVSNLTNAGQTATSEAALATKGLADADKAHTDAQNAVFSDQEALAKAQASGDRTAIESAQNKLTQDQENEKKTAEALTSARSNSQKANEALNAELMKTETPEETRDRLAAEANSNLSAAQISQRSAQDALTIAQTRLDQARENGASEEVQKILGNNVDAAQAQLNQANTNLTTATQSADAASADADSPLGVAQNNIQQLQAQQQDLQSQQQDAASAAAAAGTVITSAPAGSPQQQAAQETKAEAEAQVAELQKKIDVGNAALEEAKAKLTLAHQNEKNYQQALAERRLAKRSQREAAKEEIAAQKNFDTLKNTAGTTPEQLAVAQARLDAALAKNSRATEELKKKEEAFQKAENLAQTPLQRLRLKVNQNQAKMAELQLDKAKIYQDLTAKKAALKQQVDRNNPKTPNLRAEVSQLEFRYDDTNQKIQSLQRSINEDQAKIEAVDQAVNADALGGLDAIAKGISGSKKSLNASHVAGTTGTGVVTPEEEIEQEEADALSPNALDGSEGGVGVDPLAPDGDTEDGRGPQIPTFQNRSSQPIFGPGGGPVANFTSPGGTAPNFNNAAGAVATFAAGAGAVPAFNTSAGDVSFDNGAAPLPWSASSPKVPSFGTPQATPFGGGGAPMPVFGAGSQNAFGGASSAAAAAGATPLPVPGDGLTKIKSATRLAELAPPTVSEEKKQALMRAKEAVTSAAESLKAAEKTENLGTITNAQVSRDVAELKYEQALNNASPLGVPETESSGWWNKDPSSPYSGYNVDGGGRMNAPVQTSERTEHFILSNLEALQPVYEETLPDGAKVLAVENVGFAMKAGKAASTIIKLARAGAAAAA
jgi:hypothetical protein